MYQRIHRGRVIDYKLWKNAIISQFLYGKLRDSRTRVNNADNFQFDAFYNSQTNHNNRGHEIFLARCHYERSENRERNTRARVARIRCPLGPLIHVKSSRCKLSIAKYDYLLFLSPPAPLSHYYPPITINIFLVRNLNSRPSFAVGAPVFR